jgi:TonB family protein
MKRLIVALLLVLGIGQARGDQTTLCSFANTTQLTPFSLCDGEQCSAQKRWFIGCLVEQANFLLKVRGIEHTQRGNQSEFLVGANSDCSPIIEVKVSGGDEHDGLVVSVLKESFKALTPVGAKCDNFPMILRLCFGENCPKPSPPRPPNEIATVNTRPRVESSALQDLEGKSATNRPASVVKGTCSNLDEFYPRQSRQKNEQGVVLLRFTVEMDGKLLRVDVERSSGYRRLDLAAKRFLESCKFNPGMLNGKPESSSSTVEVMWRLD